MILVNTSHCSFLIPRCCTSWDNAGKSKETNTAHLI